MSLRFTTEQRKEIRRLCRVETQPLPTLLIFLAGYGLFGTALREGWQGRFGSSLVLAAIGQYFLFTSLHEAVHQAASPYRALNWFIGVASASTFFSPFVAFRYVHLKHHRHTNDQAQDPDYWSARSWLLFRWLTQDLYYYAIFLGDRRYKEKSFFRVTLQLLVNGAALTWMAHMRGWAWPILSWLLPARVTITWLSFVFNYIPHYPHDPEIQDTAVKDTCARTSRFLGVILVGQNFHNIHHLFPSAPFYRYAKIWRLTEAELVRNGAIVKRKIFTL